MDCPICKDEVMIILELAGVEVDYCVECQGVWLDEGELELLLAEAEKKEELINSFTEVEIQNERIKDCPICEQEMEKILVKAEHEVVIDNCPKNHGLWFDSGELEEIIALGSIDNDNRILTLLHNMFKFDE